MEPLTIQLAQDRYLRLLKTPSGDIIFVLVIRGNEHQAVIPKDRRDLLAEFIKIGAVQ